MPRASRDKPSSEEGPSSSSARSAAAKSEDRESSRQSDELASLRRMLVLSEGTFSLNICVYNVRRLRDELIEQLTSQLPGIALVRLPPATIDVLGVAREQVGGETPTAIFVLDLEASLPSDSTDHVVLRVLNTSREQWEQLACPVVFWLAEHAAALLASTAVDFWRYRSHAFEFTAMPLEVGRWRSESFAGFDMLHGLPYQEKLFRRAELEQRIEQAGSPPSPEMLPHVLEWMLELAELHQVVNDHAAAEALLREAVRLNEETHGDEDPFFAACLNNLAVLLKNTSRLAEAESLMRRALAIVEQANGGDHALRANALNNLAELLLSTNRVAEAEPLMRRALVIAEQTGGADSPIVATVLTNLAQLLEVTNRLTVAESLMRRALAIDEQAYGLNHPRVAIELNNLAQLLQNTNRAIEAVPLMRRALAIDERAYGASHVAVARDLYNLADLLRDTGRLEEAEPLMRRAVAILRASAQSSGHEHPQMQLTLDNYRRLLTAMKLPSDEIERRVREA